MNEKIEFLKKYDVTDLINLYNIEIKIDYSITINDNNSLYCSSSGLITAHYVNLYLQITIENCKFNTRNKKEIFTSKDPNFKEKLDNLNLHFINNKDDLLLDKVKEIFYKIHKNTENTEEIEYKTLRDFNLLYNNQIDIKKSKTYYIDENTRDFLNNLKFSTNIVSFNM